MSALILALDAGTSACKAEVFTPEGRSVSRGASGYDGADLGRTELSPQTLRAAVVGAVREALAGTDPVRIAGVGVSAQLGLATLDAQGKPIGHLVTWADTRGAEQVPRIQEIVGEARVYQVCGRRASPEWILPRLLHRRETDPSSWERTRRALSIKDYLVHELTGRILTDPTHASYTLAYDVVGRRWSSEILGAVDVPEETFPDVVAAHEVAGETGGSFAEEMGLPSGVPVVVGGPDGTMGALGAGLVDEGRAVCVVGTTDVFLACSRAPVFDPRRGTVVNCHAVPDRWSVGGPMSSTGGCLQWFARNVARSQVEEAGRQGVSPYARLDALAEPVPPGSEGLVCIPSLVGDRAPLWDPDRRGIFAGLSLLHGVGHMARAILEGSAFASRVMVERLEECGVSPDEITLAGGGALSPLWCQIRADVVGRPVSVPDVVEATNLGSALLVAVALSHYTDCATAARAMVRTGRRYEPDPARREAYESAYRSYRKLHRALAPSPEAQAAQGAPRV